MDKFCVNCRHAVNPSVGLWECHRNAKPDVVTGEPAGTSCRIERAIVSETGCGPEGRHFVQKLGVVA